MIDDDAPIDPELAEPLAALESGFKASHRRFKQALIANTVSLAGLALLDLALAVFAPIPPPLALRVRDTITVGGLAGFGLIAIWGATRAYAVVVDTHASLLKELRRNARMVTFVESVKPLMHAIRDAHGRGVALVVPPPGVEDSPIPKPPPVIH